MQFLVKIILNYFFSGLFPCPFICHKITTPKEDEEFLNLIAYNVKRIRKEREVSQLETALNIGHASGGFYANMENNSHGKHFKILHLFKLSKFFKCDICEFFKEKI